MPWLRWLNAGFLILAACRALVPGLCATQLAAGDAAAYRATHGCCAVRAADKCCSTRTAPADDDQPGVRLPLAERAACGFCSLMQGMVDPLEPAQAPAPPLAIGRIALLAAQPLISEPPSLHRGRAPPTEV